MLALKTSIALHDLCSFPMDALVIAKRTLLRSEKFQSQTDIDLTDEEVEVLHLLRDQVAMLETLLASQVRRREGRGGRNRANSHPRRPATSR